MERVKGFTEFDWNAGLERLWARFGDGTVAHSDWIERTDVFGAHAWHLAASSKIPDSADFCGNYRIQRPA